MTKKVEDKKPPPKSKEEQDSDKTRKAIQLIFRYAKAEKGSFCFGTFWLILGQISDITIPMFIGKIVDLLRNEKFDEIGKWCLGQFIIVLVSYLNLNLSNKFATFIDRGYRCRSKSHCL